MRNFSKIGNIWVVRTNNGCGPVVFMNGKATDGHKVRRAYAKKFGIDYFQVRECTMEYWLRHPEKQQATC